jgi:hypothetical protein
MKYVPQPIDTSAMALPRAIGDLTERLARNIHEIWAQRKIADGWRYGPRLDGVRKRHPWIVPYEELPNSVQEYDRSTALGTLKTLMAFGYEVRKRTEPRRRKPAGGR